MSWTTLAPYLLLAVSMALGIVGQLCFKAGMAGTADLAAVLGRWHIIGAGLFCYGVSTVAYLLCLRSMPLSVALPTLSFSAVVVAGILYATGREQPAPLHWLGMLLVVVGIGLIHAQGHKAGAT